MNNEPQFDSYLIVSCSCRCGGNYAWLGVRPSGVEEMIGCVCHHTPKELIGKLLIPRELGYLPDGTHRSKKDSEKSQ